MPSARRVLEGQVFQGTDEAIAYQIDFSNWGMPSSPFVTLFCMSDSTFKNEKLIGNASASGSIVTLPAVGGLDKGLKYQLKCKVNIGSNVMSAFVEIIGE